MLYYSPQYRIIINSPKGWLYELTTVRQVDAVGVKIQPSTYISAILRLDLATDGVKN